MDDVSDREFGLAGKVSDDAEPGTGESDDDFTTPRPRHSDDGFSDAVKAADPLLPPRNEEEERRDSADEIPTP